MNKDIKKLASQILDAVGGEDNISYCGHCVTRLRLTLKDRSKINHHFFENVEGVFGTKWSGDQFQIIVGQNVGTVYSQLCKLANIAEQEIIDENLDETLTKEKLSLKTVGQKAMSYLSLTITNCLPIFIAAGMCKTVAVLLGPEILNVINETSDVYIVLNLLYSVSFYFLPVYLGYSAAKVLGYNPMYGLYLGLMILLPDFVALVGVRETISVFGISAPVANYSQSVLPIILGAFIGKYVLMLLEKYCPKVISAVAVPTLFAVIMAPIMFGACAPAGTVAGELIGNLFYSLANANVIVRILACTVILAVYPYILMFGMHWLLVNLAIVTYMQNGFEAFALPLGVFYSWAIYGLALSVFIKLKNKEDKSNAFSCFITGFLGGVSEPAMYGVALKYKNAMKVLMIACGVGGLLEGIFQPAYYTLASFVNVFSIITPWVSGGTQNMIGGLICQTIPFVIAFLGGLALVDGTPRESKGVV